MSIILTKDILILGKGPTQVLDNTTLFAEKEHSINFTEQQMKLWFWVNSYIFVNGVEINKLKAKDSEINVVSLFLGNVSKEISFDSMNKTGLHGYVYDFSVGYDNIDDIDILDIHKYLRVKKKIKKCSGLINNRLLYY